MLPCNMRTKEAMDSFSPMEQQVAAFTLSRPREVANMSIEELANACNTSVSSVVRFCKSAGYSGYKEFLRELSANLAVEKAEAITYTDVHPGSSIQNIIHSVAHGNMQSIENTLSVLDMKELERAVKFIAKAPRVDFYGVGSSGLVALDAHNKFIRINKNGYGSGDPHQQILLASTLKKGDAAVLISYSGDARDIIELADIVKKSPATLISLTRYGKNELSKRADIRLYCSSTELLIRSGATGSRISMLTVADMLYIAVASRLYEDVKPYLDETRRIAAEKHGGGRTGQCGHS